jgi:hypothetical protein
MQCLHIRLHRSKSETNNGNQSPVNDSKVYVKYYSTIIKWWCYLNTPIREGVDSPHWKKLMLLPILGSNIICNQLCKPHQKTVRNVTLSSNCSPCTVSPYGLRKKTQLFKLCPQLLQIKPSHARLFLSIMRVRHKRSIKCNKQLITGL